MAKLNNALNDCDRATVSLDAFSVYVSVNVDCDKATMLCLSSHFLRPFLQVPQVPRLQGGREHPPPCEQPGHDLDGAVHGAGAAGDQHGQARAHHVHKVGGGEGRKGGILQVNFMTVKIS